MVLGYALVGPSGSVFFFGAPLDFKGASLIIKQC